MEARWLFPASSASAEMDTAAPSTGVGAIWPDTMPYILNARSRIASVSSG